MEESSPAAVAVARNRLAHELGCEPSSILVDKVEEVEWSDSSLGCPQPGMMYMQVITPGYRITLEHAGQRYIMHTNRGSHAVHCPDAGDARSSPHI